MHHVADVVIHVFQVVIHVFEVVIDVADVVHDVAGPSKQVAAGTKKSGPAGPDHETPYPWPARSPCGQRAQPTLLVPSFSSPDRGRRLTLKRVPRSLRRPVRPCALPETLSSP